MPRAQVSREQLTESLRSVFVARGYEGATLAELARACGLGKASLYHHFPGGKAEMAQMIVRHSVAELERDVFSPLRDTQIEPPARIEAFVNAFGAYLANGRGHCMLAVLAQSSARADYAAVIREQLRSWLKLLAQTLEAGGAKPKRARRQARALLASVYGQLILAKMLDDEDGYTNALRRVAKDAT